MNIGLIWNSFYAHFTDDETRSAQVFADFVCWCHVERISNNHARRIVVEAATNADLSLPEDFFALAFMSGVPKFPGQPDPNDQYLRAAPNESVRRRAGIFLSIIERFYSDEFGNHLASAATHVLRDVFRIINDVESLYRIIESGDGRYSSIAGLKVMRGDEFYSLAELDEKVDPGELDEFLREYGYSRDPEPLVLGNHFIEWLVARKIIWRFPEQDDDGLVPDRD